MARKMSLNEIRKALADKGYIANDNICYAIFTALMLDKPLLIEGNVGTGKTELAKVMSEILESEFIRLQCYEGIDADRALFSINYPKQLLYQNILKSSLDEIIKNKNFDDAVAALDKNTNFYSMDFIIERPILRSISPLDDNPKCLLIDELDKAEIELEYVLLETLDEGSITSPEFGKIQCNTNNKPFTIITSNSSRELSQALKRRAVYLYIDYPTVENECKIIESKCNVNHDFALSLATMVNKIRTMDLKQAPSIAESVEWATLLYNHLDITSLDVVSEEKRISLEYSLQVLLKNKKDIDKVKSVLSSLL